jgi:ATP/maltotriose-dependent transcriptional regulator MalT
MQPGTLPPLVKAKLSPPRVSDACLRPDTLDLLSEHFRRRVTLICAPAGYGKTTVAVEAIRRLALRAVWYKLDVLDQDPVALIASLVEALARLQKGFGQTIRDRLANAHDVPYPIEQMAAEFVAEATEAIAQDVHLVLDDYHEAADSQALNATLDYLVANLPDTMRFIVLSRYEPAFGVGKLRLDGELGVVGVEQLRFGPAEVLEVVARRAGKSLTPERAAGLADLTEGWPASVVLAAMSVRWVDVETLESALSDPRLKQDVFSYLAEQVYSREAPEVRAFLRRTCCLDYVSADLATRVGAPRRTHRILTHLQENGVFTFATDQEGTFRYHSLFREFLRQKSIQEDGPARFHRLQLDTAAALEAHGDAEKAVDLCLAANEPRLGLDVVSRVGETNLDAFRSDTLEDWIQRLPDHVRHSEPWAQLIACQVHMRAGRFDEALRHDALAIERFRQASDSRGLYHALSAKERTLFWQGKAAEAVQACRQALQVADTPEQRVHTLISLGAALEGECRWNEATEALDTARELAAGSFQGELARLAAHTAYISSNTGRYRLAAQDIDHASHGVTGHGSPSLQMAFLNFASTNHLFVADWARSRDALEAARHLGERYGYLFLKALVDDVDGQLSAATGDLERSAMARALAVDAPSIADDPYCRSLALCHAGTAARRAGDTGIAVNWYRSAVEAAGDTAAPYAHLNAAANLAFSVDDDAHGSLERLADIARQARELDLLFVALKAEFFAATLLYRHGDRSKALDRLAQCVPEQVELGHLNFLVQELVLEPDLAIDFVHTAADEQTVDSLLELIARHWKGMQLIVACQTLDPVAGVAAARAAVAHRSEAEIMSILAKAARSPFAEVRRVAAALRRARRDAPAHEASNRLDLTKREWQILGMIAEGHLNADISGQLFLAPATVKTHVNHIFAKLGVRDRVQAVLLFRKATDEPPPTRLSSTVGPAQARRNTTVG